MDIEEVDAHEEFREATGRWVTGQSGIEYRVHGALLTEYIVWEGAIPSLLPLTNGDDPKIDEKAAVRRGLDMIRCCCDAMRFRGKRFGKLIPPERIPIGDIAQVVMAINEASGIKGPEAEVAGRVLPE